MIDSRKPIDLCVGNISAWQHDAQCCSQRNVSTNIPRRSARNQLEALASHVVIEQKEIFPTGLSAVPTARQNEFSGMARGQCPAEAEEIVKEIKQGFQPFFRLEMRKESGTKARSLEQLRKLVWHKSGTKKRVK